MDFARIWSSILHDLEEKDASSVFLNILRRTSLISVVDNEATIKCDNLGIKVFLQSRYSYLEDLISEKIKRSVRIALVVREKKVKESSIASPLLYYEDGRKTVVRESGLQDRFTFESYAVSDSNQIAYTAAKRVAQEPGQSYNPLFMYGGVGYGKTHLLHSIGNKILNKKNTHHILYCTSEDFTNDLIEHIRTKTTVQFRKKYRNVDVLLIDDIQFLAGKNYIQEEFYHTFNTIVRKGGQIALTSDRPPREIQRLEDRLKSRFSGGLIIDIQKPDFELRCAILLIKARERKINIGMDAAKLIAEQIIDTRELEGKLFHLYAKTLEKGGEITEDVVSQELKNNKKEILKKITPNDVIQQVAIYYDIRPSHIKDRDRREKIALPRQIVMYILRKKLELKLDEVAYLLKRKDHTTVMHGVDKITAKLVKDPQFKKVVGDIIDSL